MCNNIETVLAPSKLAHVVLRTGENFKAMVAFYKTILGAHASHEDSHLAFLAYDDEHHRVAILQFPGLTKCENGIGLEHVAFTYSNIRDLLTAYKQRKAHGILPAWTVNHGPTLSMYYVDPDGNKVEMQVDSFHTEEEAKSFFASSQFAENPIGVDLDPEDLVRRLESGEPEHEISKRPDIGRRGLENVPSIFPIDRSAL